MTRLKTNLNFCLGLGTLLLLAGCASEPKEFEYKNLTEEVEAIKADATTARQRASVRIRHRPGLTADMRVLIDGAPFEIKSIQPVGRRAWLDLACERLS